MKKKILSILLVICLMIGMLIGLTACGNDEKDDDEVDDNTKSTAEKVYENEIEKVNNNLENLESTEIERFNSTFSTYEGKRLGSEVSELINSCIANATENSDADDKLPDIIYIDSGTTKHVNLADTSDTTFYTASGDEMEVEDVIEAVGLTEGSGAGTQTLLIQSDSSDDGINNMGKLKIQLSPKHYYSVRCHNDEKTGLIDCILIKY